MRKGGEEGKRAETKNNGVCRGERMALPCDLGHEVKTPLS